MLIDLNSRCLWIKAQLVKGEPHFVLYFWTTCTGLRRWLQKEISQLLCKRKLVCGSGLYSWKCHFCTYHISLCLLWRSSCQLGRSTFGHQIWFELFGQNERKITLQRLLRAFKSQHDGTCALYFLSWTFWRLSSAASNFDFTLLWLLALVSSSGCQQLERAK